MTGYIDNYNFAELDVQKYWQPPSTWSPEKVKTETKSRIFSGEWSGARKVDGALYVFLKDEDGNVTLRGRSKGVEGEYIDKWDHLPHLQEWADGLPNGTCFLGEVYNELAEGSNETTKIMGALTEKAIARQATNKMRYYVFDVMAYNNQSCLKYKFSERISTVDYLSELHLSPYVDYAIYYDGEKLWDVLQDLLANGYEGMVITKNDSYYEPGKRPSKTTLKVKKALKQSIDVYLTGKAAAPARDYTGKEVESWTYWFDSISGERLPEGEHYYEAMHEGKPYLPCTQSWYKHWAGSLEIAVRRDGEEFSLGYISGFPNEVKEHYKDYTHKVLEVGAMQLTDSEPIRLRHGKVIGWRNDKEWEDCDYSQLVQ